MTNTRFVSRDLRLRFVCLSLSCALLVSPFILRARTSAPAAASGSRLSAAAPVPPPPNRTSNAALSRSDEREGELLTSFQQDVSQQPLNRHRGEPGGGFSMAPPQAPGNAHELNLPNLDHLANAKAEKLRPKPPIQANLTCADCDPQSGGGGGQHHPSGDPNFATARLQPANETGEEGVDLGSRNFNWSLPLLSLPGRAGLDVNLALYYNSLVWTKDGSFIKYNADMGTPAPGFRLALPTLQQRFNNSQTAINAYVMVTPSGGRIEMREVSFGVYESADGSYTQLKEGTTYNLFARHSGQAAAVAGASTANGAQLVQWPNTPGAGHFEWQLVPTDSGYYKLVARHSGKVAAVAAVSQSDGAAVLQWDWAEGAAHEQWQVIPTNSGYYRLVARHGGKVLQVSAGSQTPGANLQQWSYNGGLHQQWRVVPLPTENVTVRTTDGTQFTFTRVALNNEFRCTQIKDRNGNFMSATYDLNNGHLQTITDTLGRVVTFVYDGNNNLQALRQTWDGANHDWASFSYGDVMVAPNFGGGLLVNGPTGNMVTVLTRVNLHDGSYFTFEYNPGFGQVKKISRYAPDNHLLAYTSYNLNSSAGQTDCPRFTERRDWVEFGVMNQSQEVVTSYSVAADDSWSRVTAPDGTVYKELFETTGWRKGMTRRTETFSSDDLTNPKKWTTTAWTQDDENLPFPKNPRVTETNLFDANGNRRRTTIEYHPSFSLPFIVREWGGAGGDVPLRVTATGYRFDAGYIDRRIIGLVSDQHVYDGPTGAVVSKLIYQYDLGNEFLQFQGDATQHDPAYNTSFVWRGNLWSVLRFNADAVNDWNQIVEARTGYNTNGSPIFTYDALGHQTTIGYNDSFSDGVNRNTFAYPTGVSDPDNFSSARQYKYETGAVTRTQDPKGAAQRMDYDVVGRVDRVTNLVNNAYTRFVYPASMNFVQTFTTVQSLTSEVRAEQHFDGIGRVRANSATFPGSAGGYRATHVMYDAMGRTVLQGGPIEINASWVPSGDDAATGWSWTQQAYDWQGRPTITTKPDGFTTELSYSGCGCAGGDVVTARDERGRRRKAYKDTLGRLVKVEELNYDGSVYSTATYTHNSRDQITSIRHYQGLETSGIFQQRTVEYDGHGRLFRRTTPEQGVTEFAYNRDDTTAWMKDARGVKTVFGYNNRHLVTSLTYDLSGVLPGQNVQATPNVSFQYDAAGNRTQMTDGLGTVAYHYDTLSRMDWEERNFTGVGTYRLSYSYNLAGQLTSLTNPWGSVVNYSRDIAGQVTGVGGSGQWSNGTYAQDIRYRAWGGLKQMTFGNSRSLSVSYDSLKRVRRWDITTVMGWEYAYATYYAENTGRVMFARNLYDSTLDRSYDYDQVGRLFISYTGAEATAHAYTGQWGTSNGPYGQSYLYDVWGNITQRNGSGGWNPQVSYSYANNRNTALQYDLAGNVTWDGSILRYDATGQQVQATKMGAWNVTQYYNGDRLRVKKLDNFITYYLRSSVLGGQVVAELDESGAWTRGFVYDGGGQLLTIQQQGGNRWMHQDPVTKSKRMTDTVGGVAAIIDLDPWGGETNRTVNGSLLSRKYTTYDRNSNGRDEAMFRSYHAWFSRFDQPDPNDGSYDLTDPQSFNRYTYAGNDPVNFVDPSGLLRLIFWGVACTSVDGGALHCSYYIESIIDLPDPIGDLGGREPREPQNPRGPVVTDPGEAPPNLIIERAAAARAAQLLQQQRCADFVRNVYDNAIAILGGTVSPFGITPTNDAPVGMDGRAVAPSQTPASVSLNLYNTALAEGRVSRSGTNIGTAVGQTRNYNTITWNNVFYGLGMDDRARHTIHEGFHQIPNVTDFVLLEAGARAAGMETPRASSNSEASRLFNDILFARCGGGDR
jgi:RHS repeat-associated protein